MLKNKDKNKLHRFIVDENNKLAFETANQLTCSHNAKYNPVHFFGPTGVGKTHLLRSIAASFSKENYLVVLKTAKKFYWEYVYALKNKEYQKFRMEHRKIQLLIIEDLDFLQKKNSTQKELMFILDELLSKNKIVITSSQLPPKKFKFFRPALASRLTSGLSIPMQTISKKTVENYYNRMAAKVSLSMDEKILALFNKHSIEAKLREKIENLFLFCATNQKQITATLIQKCLANFEQKILNTDIIVQLVAEHYYVEDITILRNKNCPRIYKEPRYIAITLTKELLQMSNFNITKYFGECSESSIRHARKMVKQHFDNPYSILKKKALRF